MNKIASVSDSFSTSRIAGVDCVAATREELARWMVRVCRSAPEYPLMAYSLNGQGVEMMAREPYRAAMAQADLVHADGMSIVFASRLWGRTPIPERSATTDLVHDVAPRAVEAGLSFYLLGGSQPSVEAAAQALRDAYPGLRIVGAEDGYFEAGQDADICARIRASGADILWLGLGRPQQEVWAMRNRTHLAGVSVIKTCGGLFSHLGGEVRRAPLWMQRSGLEWFWRFLMEPRRLAYRSFVSHSRAVLRLVCPG